MIVFVKLRVSSAETSLHQTVADWLWLQSDILQVIDAPRLSPRTPWLLSNTLDCFNAALRSILGKIQARAPRALAVTQESHSYERSKAYIHNKSPRNTVIIKLCNLAGLTSRCSNVRDATRKVAASNQCTALRQIVHLLTNRGTDVKERGVQAAVEFIILKPLIQYITPLVNCQPGPTRQIARPWRGSLSQQFQIAAVLAVPDCVARCIDPRRLAGRYHRRDPTSDVVRCES